MGVVSKVVAGVLALVGILIVLASLGKFALYLQAPDTWFLSQGIARLIVGGVFLGAAWLVESQTE